MAERDLKKYFLKRIKERGGFARKCRWEGRNFAPDWFVVLNHKVALVELKDLGKEPTKMQDREIEKLSEAGVNATWVNCEEHVDRLINWLMDEISPLEELFR